MQRIFRLVTIALLVASLSCSQRRKTVAQGSAASAGAPDAAAADPFADLLVDSSACGTPAKQSLSRAAADRDLAVVERVLRRGYAGFDELARRGLNWESVFARARQELAALPETISSEQLRQRLLDWFAPAGDNHLAFYAPTAQGNTLYGSTGQHYRSFTADLLLAPGPRRSVIASKDSLVPQGATLVGCDGIELDGVARPTWTGAPGALSYQLIVLRKEDRPGPLRCRFDTSGDRLERDLALRRLQVSAPPERNGPVFELTPGVIPIVRLRSLDSQNRRELKAFIASAPSLRNSSVVVWDVRGNGGGSDDFARDFLLELSQQELSYHTVDRLESEITLQADVNSATCDLASPGLEPEAREYFNELLRSARSDLATARSRIGHPFREWHSYRRVFPGRAPVPFRGRLLVLVDKGCASSCESIVMYARQIPGTVVVGENTSGTGTFGEVRTLRLPESGIWIQIPTKWFHAPDTGPEGIGYKPDLWLDSVEPVSAAKALAECLSGVCRRRVEEAIASAAAR